MRVRRGEGGRADLVDECMLDGHSPNSETGKNYFFSFNVSYKGKSRNGVCFDGVIFVDGLICHSESHKARIFDRR